MKEFIKILNANKRTILGLVGAIALIILNIIETYSSTSIAPEIQYAIISIVSFCNVRGVLGRGFESVEQFLTKTQKVIDEVEAQIDNQQEE